MKNNPSKAGEKIEGTLETYCGCFEVFAIHTRFDAPQWFVYDLREYDEVTDTGYKIIRQTNTKEEAIFGLGEPA